MDENEIGCRIKFIGSENGGEFTSKQFNDYCKYHGIRIQFTIPKIRQRNGVAERANKFIEHLSRAMMSEGNLP